MKRTAVIIALGLGALFLSGCVEDEPKQTADQEQAAATARATAEANRQVGMPNIVNFQERRLMKQIFELRDREDLVTYAYITSLRGEVIFIGKCIGFGLPASVQFTNPQRPWLEDGIGSVRDVGFPMPQPDPNGLFMPEGLAATWLMMLDPETNEARPVYIEQEIIVSPFPLPTAVYPQG